MIGLLNLTDFENRLAVEVGVGLLIINLPSVITFIWFFEKGTDVIQPLSHGSLLSSLQAGENSGNEVGL